MKKLLSFLLGIIIFSCNLIAKDKIVAKFKGGIVTNQDVQILIDEIPQPFRKLIQQNSNDFEKRAILLKLISLEYKNKKLDSDTKRKIELCKDRILLKKFFDEKLKKVKVTEKEIKDYYLSHKNEYKSQNAFKFNLIVFNNIDEANKIYQKIKKGEKFEKFVRGSFYNNFIPEKNLPKEFTKRLIKLKSNEISKPFEFNKKFYIVKLIDKKYIPGKKFNEVKNSIKNKLLAEKRKIARENAEKELFAKYNVKFLK